MSRRPLPRLRIAAALAATCAGTAQAVGGHGAFPLHADPVRIERSESLVWLLLTVLFVTLGLVTLFVWSAWRQFRRPRPEDELMEEIYRETHSPPQPPATPPPAADESWERPADWWKS